MGLSLGFLQWNFGQNTLQPLIKEFIVNHSVKAEQIMKEGKDELLAAIKNSTALFYAQQKMNNKSNKIVDPWFSRLKNLCSTIDFQKIQDKYANPYIDKAILMCDKFSIHTERAFCLFFDIAVQNGSVKNPPEVSTMGNYDKLKTIVEAVVSSSNKKWMSDVRSRKECILKGEGTVHGTHRVLQIGDEEAFE